MEFAPRRRCGLSSSELDCCSMVICRDLKILEVLTHDHDFEQEGLQILL